MSRIPAVFQPIVLLLTMAVCSGAVRAQEVQLAEDSLNGLWISEVPLGDETITRRLLIDVTESNVVDDVLTEAGVFRYERITSKGTLVVEGPFRHVFEDGRGVVDLRSGDIGLRYGRRVAIDEIERPTPDSLRIGFTLWQAVSCSCAVSIDRGDVIFTREANAQRAFPRGPMQFLKQQPKVVWTNLLAPLFAPDLTAPIEARELVDAQ